MEERLSLTARFRLQLKYHRLQSKKVRPSAAATSVFLLSKATMRARSGEIWLALSSGVLSTKILWSALSIRPQPVRAEIPGLGEDDVDRSGHHRCRTIELPQALSEWLDIRCWLVDCLLRCALRGQAGALTVRGAHLHGYGMFFTVRTWRNGRRKGLKIPWPKGCEGSNPSVRTNKIRGLRATANW